MISPKQHFIETIYLFSNNRYLVQQHWTSNSWRVYWLLRRAILWYHWTDLTHRTLCPRVLLCRKINHSHTQWHYDWGPMYSWTLLPGGNCCTHSLSWWKVHDQHRSCWMLELHTRALLHHWTHSWWLPSRVLLPWGHWANLGILPSRNFQYLHRFVGCW